MMMTVVMMMMVVMVATIRVKLGTIGAKPRLVGIAHFLREASL